MSDLYTFLQEHEVLVFFLVLSLGYLLGRIGVSGVSLGPAGGVLLAGLGFGYFGFKMYPPTQTLGFALFIFCVGYQAGPRFFDVLMTDGLKYLALALVVALAGFGLSVLFAKVLGFAPGIAAGLLGGALTTTPTLAAAQDAVRSGLFAVPEGLTQKDVLTNIGAGYALTYLFGLVGLILTVRLMPRVLRIDLAAEAEKLDAHSGEDDGPDLLQVAHRTYRVTREEFLDKTVDELELLGGHVAIVAIRRDGEDLTVGYDTRLALGDEVLVVGRTESLLDKARYLGEEIPDDVGLSVPMTSMQVVVSHPDATNKPIGEIKLSEKPIALLVQVKRQRTVLPLTTELVLHRGDVLTMYGPESSAERMVQGLGHVERDVVDTDLFTFGLGIACGIALGTLAVTVAGVTLGLGMAGGLLITGLAVGFTRSIYPVFGRVPSASRWVLMELGLMMFMAGVGLNAGGGIVDVVKQAGPQLIGAGIVVTLVPIFVGYGFATKILKLNPVEALGGVTGSMTSGAALSVVNDAAKSNAPALGYTGAYAFANVILTIAGTLIMLLS